jgi:hypothetical protein
MRRRINMPYISKYQRPDLDELVMLATSGKANIKELSPGDMNYLITRLCMAHIGDMSYTKASAVVGTLECVKLELYRRALAPYEDQKIEENGDVKEYLA